MCAITQTRVPPGAAEVVTSKEVHRRQRSEGVSEAELPSADVRIGTWRDHRWSWLGHILRMDKDRLVRKVLLNCVQPTKESLQYMAKFQTYPSRKGYFGPLSETLLTLLQLPLIEVGNAMRAYCYSIASYP